MEEKRGEKRSGEERGVEESRGKLFLFLSPFAKSVVSCRFQSHASNSHVIFFPR